MKKIIIILVALLVLLFSHQIYAQTPWMTLIGQTSSGPTLTVIITCSACPPADCVNPGGILITWAGSTYFIEAPTGMPCVGAPANTVACVTLSPPVGVAVHFTTMSNWPETCGRYWGGACLGAPGDCDLTMGSNNVLVYAYYSPPV